MPYEHRITRSDYDRRRRLGASLSATNVPKILNDVLYDAYGAWYDYHSGSFLFPDQDHASAAGELCVQCLPLSAVPPSLRDEITRKGGVWCKTLRYAGESGAYWFQERAHLDAFRQRCEVQLTLNLSEDRLPAATAPPAGESPPTHQPPQPSVSASIHQECDRRRQAGFLLPASDVRISRDELRALDAIPERREDEVIGYLLPSQVALDRGLGLYRPTPAEPSQDGPTSATDLLRGAVQKMADSPTTAETGMMLINLLKKAGALRDAEAA